MASKKTSKKIAKKVSKKTSKTVPRAGAPAKRRVVGLTNEQRAGLVRPPADYDDAIDTMVGAWDAHRADVRVPGLSVAKLRSLGRAAQRAWTRENELRQKLEARLARLTDARMIAEDEAWRAALDVYDLAKSVGRRRPEIAEAFEFMSRYTKRARREGGEEPSPSPEADS